LPAACFLPESLVVRDEPESLPRGLILAALADRWGIVGVDIDYLPVGAGGHHWLVQDTDSARWFITANSLFVRGHWLEADAEAIFARAKAAYETARQLGFGFVLAAVADRRGEVLHRVHPDWALSVYPYRPGVSDDASRVTVAGFIGQLHEIPVPATAPRWRTELPHRDCIESVLAERDSPPWTTGPYGEPTRRLLTENRDRVREMLACYDRLAAEVDSDPEPWVLTHGEPHWANTLRLADGTTYLIDWDSVAIAPRERDLWQLLDTPTGPVWEAYVGGAAAGAGVNGVRMPRPAAMEMFRRWWPLAEIGEYVRQFSRPHSGNADDAAAWRELCEYVGSDSAQ
jgi:spectinomycin phosphotransferase